MRKTKSFKIGEDEFVARELTVSQVSQLLDGGTVEEKVNIIDLLFPDRMPSEAVAMSLGITSDELAERDYPPSVLEKVLDEVEAINPISANLIRRLANLGRAAMEKSQGQRPD